MWAVGDYRDPHTQEVHPSIGSDLGQVTWPTPNQLPRKLCWVLDSTCIENGIHTSYGSLKELPWLGTQILGDLGHTLQIMSQILQEHQTVSKHSENEQLPCDPSLPVVP